MPASYFAPKGLRTKFTDEQRDALEEFFSQNPRLTHDTLEAFASEHNLTISAVRNWVNNRKQRLKRNYGSSFEGNDPKIPKVDKETNFNEQSTQRSSNGQIDSLKVNVGNFKQIDKDKGEDSPVASPTMVNGPRFKQGDNNGMDTKKSAQGNGLLSDIFDGSTGIPTMVDNVSMDCLGTAAE